MLHGSGQTDIRELVPRHTFEQQSPGPFQGFQIEVCQWASPVAVRPLAQLLVEPDDFPFLAQVHGHDPAAIRERAARDLERFPWLDD